MGDEVTGGRGASGALIRCEKMRWPEELGGDQTTSQALESAR